jgi:glutathione S-transferase
MVVVPGVPSPWGEAAKGIFHVKRIAWAALRLDIGNQEMIDWIGGKGSGPVAIYNDEPPRAGWAEILLLAERLASAPSLLPADAGERALAFGLAHEICGEMGLGWCRRNQGVDAGLNGRGGFPEPVAQYLANKYGYRASESDVYTQRVVDILNTLSTRLHAQKDAGSRFYLGDTLSAVDIYSATFAGLLKPLPDEHCPMPDFLRAGFESLDPATAAALDPILLEHRDFVYSEHLELPLTL